MRIGGLGAPRVEQELFALTREHEALKQQHKELQQKKFNYTSCGKS